MAYKDAKGQEIEVGDRVQIVNGGQDVTNGSIGKPGSWYYIEGSKLDAEVELIDPKWYTGGLYGLPQYVVKVRCRNQGVVVWQVQPQHCVITQKKNPPKKEDPPKKVEPKPQVKPKEPETSPTKVAKVITLPMSFPDGEFAPEQGSDIWYKGINPNVNDGDNKLAIQDESIATIKDIGYWESAVDVTTGTWRKLKPLNMHKELINGKWVNVANSERTSIGNTDTILVDESAIRPVQSDLYIDNANVRNLMLNNYEDRIQNEKGYPEIVNKGYQRVSGGEITGEMTQYNYQTKMTDSLEDKLALARKKLGLQVHGSDRIGRAIKYYLFNRFKVPDTNLAHSKSVTYIFFTRPDLNLLDVSNIKKLVPQQHIMDNVETALTYRTHPHIFKLLTDSQRCGDKDNFNMLLSNQVTSVDISDETLDMDTVGKTWCEYYMNYAHSYSGRTGGDFTCTFTELSDLSVSSLMKLWLTYIDNVARGAWSPSYNLAGSTGSGPSHAINQSHVYSKTLDYAASMYLIRCAADGETVLFWTKYYGVIPENTGASAFSFDVGNGLGAGDKLSIRFKYAMKKDWSPISLLEFNDNAHVKDIVNYANSFDLDTGSYATGASREPFVGTPYIVMDLADPIITPGGVNYNSPESKIRLKFKKATDIIDPNLESILYRSRK